MVSVWRGGKCEREVVVPLLGTEGLLSAWPCLCFLPWQGPNVPGAQSSPLPDAALS